MLTAEGKEEQIKDVRIRMSHEFMNQVNLTMYQFFTEVQYKQVKHATIFQAFADQEGCIKKSEFLQTINKYSVMSEYQANILLLFYDCLNTEFINGNLFIEHLTHKDFIGYANQVCIKNDLIPYCLLQNLTRLEQLRLNKIYEAFKEALSRVPPPAADDPTLQLT